MREEPKKPDPPRKRTPSCFDLLYVEKKSPSARRKAPRFKPTANPRGAGFPLKKRSPRKAASRRQKKKGDDLLSQKKRGDPPCGAKNSSCKEKKTLKSSGPTRTRVDDCARNKKKKEVKNTPGQSGEIVVLYQKKRKRRRDTRRGTGVGFQRGFVGGRRLVTEGKRAEPGKRKGHGPQNELVRLRKGAPTPSRKGRAGKFSCAEEALSRDRRRTFKASRQGGNLVPEY